MMVQGGYVSGNAAQQLIVKRSNALDKRAPRGGRSPTPQSVNADSQAPQTDALPPVAPAAPQGPTLTVIFLHTSRFYFLIFSVGLIMRLFVYGSG